MRAFPCLASFSTIALIVSMSAATAGSGPVMLEAHNCKCIAGDRLYAQGEVACIRGQPMQCGMSLNTSSWLLLAGKCTENRLSSLPSSRRVPRSVTPL